MKAKVSIPIKSASLLLLRKAPKLSFYNYEILVLERKVYHHKHIARVIIWLWPYLSRRENRTDP